MKMLASLLLAILAALAVIRLSDMIWLKSLAMGFVAVLVFAFIWLFVVPLLVTAHYGGGMTAVKITPNHLSTWLIPIAVFLLGFGLELGRLGH